MYVGQEIVIQAPSLPAHSGKKGMIVRIGEANYPPVPYYWVRIHGRTSEIGLYANEMKPTF